MTYKTILVHIDESRRAPDRIRIAAGIALAEEAHLVAAAVTGVSKFIYQSGLIGEGYIDVGPYQQFLQDHAEQALAKFDQVIEHIGLVSLEKRVINDEAAVGVSLQARYCDLTVIGQTDPDEESPTVSQDFPEQVVLHAGRPVLIIPYIGQFNQIGKNVLVAWNAGIEATRAIAGAIPLLKRADTVRVAVFNAAEETNVHGVESYTDIARYLERHGIKAEISQPLADTDIGNALLSLAADVNSDLLVMGGYGHSRFREILLGGVTRTVLESMTIPVLMTH